MTDQVPEFASPQEALAHYGVKGMRWGVRKSELPAPPTPSSSGVKVGSDGSISIAKGASLQRLVRSNGKSLPMKDITYASLNAYDTARYVKTIGGKGILGGGRDQILGIKATKAIKAPSMIEATKINSELMLNNSKYREKNTTMIGTEISRKELAQIRQDPAGKMAQSWYRVTNTKMTFDSSFDPDAPFVQKALREAVLAKGFNALRDENDFTSGIAKAPIIIFNPQESLRVTSKTMITDELRRANKQQLKQYKRLGKDWLDKELYS